MPKAETDFKITQSIFDRLVDADPRITPERQLKAAVRRDLEWLLNTRRVVEPPPESLVVQLRPSGFFFLQPEFAKGSQ
jgi:type VI secretion system protein ImpF